MSSEHSAFEIAAAVADMKTEILRDIEAGTLPADVPDFVALHDHVDANDYAGFTDPNRRADWDVADLVLVQEEVDAWLKAGRRERVDLDALPLSDPIFDPLFNTPQDVDPDPVSEGVDVPPNWIGGRVRLVIEATVEADEWRAFVAPYLAREDREVAESFDARMDEVYGLDGEVLTSVRVQSVKIHPS